MDLTRLVKWLVVLVALFVVWKLTAPWVRQHLPGSTTSTGASGTDNSCIRTAQGASETWGSGIGRFANPPYNLNGWSVFVGRVTSKISAAEAACGCPAESCTKSRDAMRDLSTLVNDLDSAIRSGSAPPDDIVQRQSAIDAQLDAAQELVRSGR